MRTHELHVKRLHCVDGDYEDLGWYSKGHHEESKFRAEVEETHWYTCPHDGTRKRLKHPSSPDVEDCRFVQQWWRVTPHRFMEATPGSRGSFPVTALLSPQSSL